MPVQTFYGLRHIHFIFWLRNSNFFAKEYSNIGSILVLILELQKRLWYSSSLLCTITPENMFFASRVAVSQQLLKIACGIIQYYSVQFKCLFREINNYKEHRKNMILQQYMWYGVINIIVTLDYGQRWLVLNPSVCHEAETL